jgi:Fe-S-cluster containining protein
VTKRPLSLDEVYARIPSIDCQKQCHTTCGLIPLSLPEARRAKRHLRVVPYGNGELMFDAPLGVCPALRERDCTIYEDRPLICRFFGVVQGMECRRGCKPERLLTMPGGGRAASSEPVSPLKGSARALYSDSVCS